jgi:phosphoribosylamine--glycine ligase
MREIVDPVMAGMRSDGHDYRGFLYAGLMMTCDGPRVIEFNVRFGDPETQAVLARLKTPLGALLLAAAKGELDKAEELRWSKDTAVAVVVASENYPDTPRTGDRIRGLKKVDELDGVHVIHAGTKLDDEGKVVSAGGRVLAVVALGSDLVEARERAYDGVELVQLEGAQFRSDIGGKAARGEIKVASAAAAPSAAKAGSTPKEKA